LPANIRLRWKLRSGKHSSSLQYGNNYCHKKLQYRPQL
jgi:hypothetical protein